MSELTNRLRTSPGAFVAAQAADALDAAEAKLAVIDALTMIHSSTLARDVHRILHPTEDQ